MLPHCAKGNKILVTWLELTTSRRQSSKYNGASPRQGKKRQN